MPCNYSLYPADWKERRARILERDNNRCKFCGVPNHVYVYRDRRGWHIVQDEQRNSMIRDGVKLTLIVLTIAHKHGAPLDCPDDHLFVACQLCHLSYDAKKHAANAARTRRLKKEELGQSSLLEDAIA